MDLQKLNVKFFVEPPDTVPLTEFIDVFHGWIQATDGEYHDVADYSHMEAGPGIVLVANEANVSIDEAENRRGLLFSQKGRLEGSNQEKLRQVFHSALAYCRKLEEEPALRGKVLFATNEVAISVNDRAIATHSEEEFLQLKAEVDPIARQVFGDAAIDYERGRDPGQRLQLRLKTTAGVDLRQALANSRPQ